MPRSTCISATSTYYVACIYAMFRATGQCCVVHSHAAFTRKSIRCNKSIENVCCLRRLLRFVCNFCTRNIRQWSGVLAEHPGLHRVSSEHDRAANADFVPASCIRTCGAVGTESLSVRKRIRTPATICRLPVANPSTYTHPQTRLACHPATSNYFAARN